MDKIKISPPRLDATLSAAAGEDGARRVEVKWYTGATVDRMSWDGRYTLQLSMDPAHVRMGRFQSGTAPVLDSHSDWSLSDVIGVVESADLKGNATIRLADTPSVDETWAKVQQGIIRNGSVGAAIYKLQDVTPEESKMKQYLAVDWEPQEFSLVPVGADPNAGIRAAAQSGEIEVEVEAARATAHKEQTMEPTVETGALAREVNTDEVKAQAIVAERQRVQEINKLSVKFGVNADDAIASGKTVEQFRAFVLDQLATKSEDTAVRDHHATILRDATETRRELMGAALLNRLDSKNAVDSQNDYRGMGPMRIAEECLSASGVRTRGKSAAEIATLTMQHGTTDFPYILENVARKQMLAGYEYQQPTYRAWTKRNTTPDFKTMSRLRLSETPAFVQVPEGAQITMGTMSESKESYAIATYGRGLTFTRQMLINDDLGAFNDLLMAFGVQAARLENKTVYAILNANAAMADSVALFHASHSNLGSGAIGNTALDAMETAMATQKGLDGATVLNLKPQYLIVPAAKKATALTAMTPVGPSVKISDQNWFAGRYTVISDAELDGTSTSVWYAAADPMVAPGIEYSFLQGAEGPQFLRTDNEGGVLGISWRAFLDFGAKAVDWRPLYKSTGV
jgi:hypothetical protein